MEVGNSASAADGPRIAAAIGSRLAGPAVGARAAVVGASAAGATGAAPIAARTVGTPAAVTRRPTRALALAARSVRRRVAQLRVTIEEAAYGMVEASLECRGGLAEGGAEIAPLLLRPPHFV